jgi:hypothetical protein
MGMSLVIVLEAVPVLRRSRRHLQLFCCWVGGGLAVTGLLWGVVILVALPRGSVAATTARGIRNRLTQAAVTLLERCRATRGAWRQVPDGNRR